MNAALSASVLIASALALLVPLQDAAPPAAPAAAAPTAAHAAEEGDTPLMVEMEKIEHAEHFLRRSIGDAAQDADSLKQIAIAQQAILSAKLMPPKMAANVPEADRPKFLAEYRKTMAGLLIEFATLERALLDGDRDAAKASYKKLHAMEESGHSEFTDGS